MSAVRHTSGSDSIVAELIEELINRIQTGAGDVEAFIAAHPDHAEALRRLLPAAQVLADLSSSAQADGSFPPTEVAVASGELGDFRLAREVGRGGMGVVYEAEQISLHRRVALKVLPFASTLDSKRLKRFQNEAQAAASLHHTNIVPVYATGCERGVHYYAMQFIDGRSLAEVIAERQAGAGPGFAAPSSETVAAAQLATEPLLPNPVFFQRVAEWGVQAGEALEHAHSLGVVHRDVKPANLLVDGQGRLWLTDFGLARVGADAGLTMTGDVLGTLRYMSPEQALAKHDLVDHRSDVYSLGATLYELLTRRPAVGGKDKEEVLARIAFEEPVSPRRLDKSIPAELQTIVLKALAKEPAERYATAQELADDLSRFLQQKPILARRTGTWERFRKWARRRPALVGLMAVTVLALAGLVAGLLWHNTQLSAAVERERKLAWEADQQKQEAQKKRAVARLAVDRMYTQVASKWLDTEPGAQKLQREFLEEALRFYQELAQEPGAGPTAQQELANAYRQMGAIHLKLGQRAEAEEALNRAVAIAEELATQDPERADYQKDLASIYYQLGNLNYEVPRAKESEQYFRRSLAIHRKMADRFPSDAGNRQRIGTALINLGNVLQSTGRMPEAEAAYREARSVLLQVTVESPETAEFHVALGGALNNLAILEDQRGNFREARGLLEEAIRQQKDALRSNPRRKSALRFLDAHYSCLSEVLRELGETEKAFGAMRESIAVARRLVNEFPDIPGYRSGLATSEAALGQLYFRSGQPGEAAAAYRSALATMEQSRADLPRAAVNKQFLAGVHNSLGLALEVLDKPQDASAEYRKALQQQPDAGDAQNNLALLLADGPNLGSRDMVQAVRLISRAIELQPKNPSYWRTLGVVRYRAGDWNGAITALEKAQEWGLQGDEIVWLFLAMGQWRGGSHEQAQSSYRQALEVAKKKKPPAGAISQGLAVAKGKLPAGALPRYRAEAAALLEAKSRSP
jgi:serine/threonine protein kinase/Flp pilus assembly protein TadD